MFTGKVKGILKETEAKVKEIMKDTTLEKPIAADIMMSTRANAYDLILKEYKDFLSKKKKNEEQE
jgi:hypothetical protein